MFMKYNKYADIYVKGFVYENSLLITIIVSKNVNL